MTRDQVSATLRMMEQLRENSYEAESRRDELRMQRQYSAMWAAIQPYVTGAEPYADDVGGSHE